VFAHDLDNPHHLVPSVSLVRGNTDSRIQPDLGFTTATALHMEVAPLGAVAHEDEEAIRSDNE
jgi:hypothetical protein